MAEKNSKNKSLDDFWNIEQLIPKNKLQNSVYPKNTTPVEIEASPAKPILDDSSEFTVKKYIPPYESGNIRKADDFEWEETYIPDSSLIHRVAVKKYKSSYNYYVGFKKDAVKYKELNGEPCDFVPFFSYVPQYDQMNEKQFRYYLWFRESVRNEKTIKADQGYILLFIFELINLSTDDPLKNQKYLMYIYEEYGETFPTISSRLADWICDYGFVHKLPPPSHRTSGILKKLRVLKEYFIELPPNDMERCAKTLLAYCCSYDYRTSKFYQLQNKKLYDKYIMGALEVAVRFYSADGGILSEANTGDSVVTRDAYAGALCVSDERYRIEISFCSFSRSNELRFIIGDVVKYSENKIRSYLGIKSKMTVYSLSSELRSLIDEYFILNLPSKRQIKSNAERQEYDVLYDLPKKDFSISNAERIEQASWSTTVELIEAFEDENDFSCHDIESKYELSEIETLNTSKPEENADAFLQYRDIINALLKGDLKSINTKAMALGKMIDGVIDEINELAYEVLGDAIIEDDGDGKYSIIEDYRNMFE